MNQTYRDTLDYLYSLQFFGIKLGLENIRELLLRVGNPQQQLRIIHVAGTNGKGSTSSALASMLQAGGYRTGLYTSPHLHHFSERIRVDLEQIREAEIVALTRELRPHAQELRATFFEVTTAMALLAFARHQVDWVVLETGMGGRLDATNVVSPQLCVITPVAFDHAGYLGSSLTEIAAEKAGICKAQVPVVSAAQDAQVLAVLQERVAQLDCPFYLMGRDYRVADSDGQVLTLAGRGLELTDVHLRLAGRHQLGNLALAAAALDVLAGQVPGMSQAAMRCGLERLIWPGRLEWLADGRVLLDGAHNEAGVDVLADYLRDQQLAPVHLVVGCKADKLAERMLSRLLPFCQAVYATAPPDVEASDPQRIVAQAQQAGIAAQSYAEPQQAMAAARRACPDDGVVLVAGSLFLVAAIRKTLVADPLLLPIIG